MIERVEMPGGSALGNLYDHVLISVPAIFNKGMHAMLHQNDDIPEKPLTQEVNMTTPGAMLLAARQAKGLDVAEVATKLKLSRQCVVDLEADVTPNASAPVYVRGYLRSYATLLCLKPETVLAAYDKVTDSNEKTSEVVSSNTVYLNQPVVERVRLYKNTRRFVRWGGVALGVAMVLLVVIWWNDQRSQKPVSTPSVSLPSVQTTNLEVKPDSKAIAALTRPHLAPEKKSKVTHTQNKVKSKKTDSASLKANYSVVKVDQSAH